MESAKEAPMKTKGIEQLTKIRLKATKEDEPFDQNAPRMLLLVGIPGSGKSTFATKLQQAGWGISVSQDDLGTRFAVERAVIEALKEGTNVVVDRCNFDKAQRKHWIDYANARGCHVGVVVFAIPFQLCLKRVRERPSHPTLKGDDEDLDKIVMRLANSLVFPERQEGFSFCRVVRSDSDIERVMNEIFQGG